MSLSYAKMLTKKDDELALQKKKELEEKQKREAEQKKLEEQKKAEEARRQVRLAHKLKIEKQLEWHKVSEYKKRAGTPWKWRKAREKIPVPKTAFLFMDALEKQLDADLEPKIVLGVGGIARRSLRNLDIVKVKIGYEKSLDIDLVANTCHRQNLSALATIQQTAGRTYCALDSRHVPGLHTMIEQKSAEDKERKLPTNPTEPTEIVELVSSHYLRDPAYEEDHLLMDSLSRNDYLSTFYYDKEGNTYVATEEALDCLEKNELKLVDKTRLYQLEARLNRRKEEDFKGKSTDQISYEEDYLRLLSLIVKHAEEKIAYSPELKKSMPLGIKILRKKLDEFRQKPADEKAARANLDAIKRLNLFLYEKVFCSMRCKDIVTLFYPTLMEILFSTLVKIKGERLHCLFDPRKKIPLEYFYAGIILISDEFQLVPLSYTPNKQKEYVKLINYHIDNNPLFATCFKDIPDNQRVEIFNAMRDKIFPFKTINRFPVGEAVPDEAGKLIPPPTGFRWSFASNGYIQQMIAMPLIFKKLYLVDEAMFDTEAEKFVLPNPNHRWCITLDNELVQMEEKPGFGWYEFNKKGTREVRFQQMPLTELDFHVRIRAQTKQPSKSTTFVRQELETSKTGMFGGAPDQKDTLPLLVPKVPNSQAPVSETPLKRVEPNGTPLLTTKR